MDARLAERQLIQEEASAEHGGGNNSSSSSSSSKGKGKGKGKLKRISSGRKSLLANLPKKVQPTPLPSFALEHLQAFVDTPEPPQELPSDPPTPIASDHPYATDHDIEVPDSQIELPAPAPTTDNAGNAPMSPPMTSSIAIPASMPEKKSKKSKKNGEKRTRAEMEPSNGLSEQVVADENGDSINGTAETVAPASPSPQRKRKRRKPRVEPEAGVDETEERSTHALDVVETPISTKNPRKKGQLLRKPAVLDPIEDDDVPPGSPDRVDHEVQMLESTHSRPDNVGDGDGLSQLGEGLISRHRRAKPRLEKSPESWSVPDTSSASIDSDPISDDDMNYAPPAHEDTPPTAEDASPDGDEMLRASTSNTKTPKRKKQKERKKRNPKATKETARSNAPRTSEQRRQPGRKRTLGEFESVAERSLNTVRQLNHPPDLRDGGSFTNDEEELIRRAIHDYQQRKNLETQDLVEIVQWTDDSHDRSMHRPLSEWRQEELDARRESAEFWQDLQQIGLTRKFVRIKNHVRSHYHTYKIGSWTEEEDEEIESLYKLHPNRWKLISQILGTRSPLDVQNRWKDYVQFGGSRKMQRWTEEEESLLEQAVVKVVDRLKAHQAATQQDPRQVYTSADINWLQVASEMGNVRSRLQCFVKWQRMKGNETIRPPPDDSARAGSSPRETIEEASNPLKPRRKSGKSAASTVSSSEHAKEPGKKAQKKRRKRSSNIALNAAVDDQQDAESETPKSGAEEDHTAASVPNTKRKRQSNVSQGASTSRTTPAKKKKLSSVDSTPRLFKSTEMITASDDE